VIESNHAGSTSNSLEHEIATLKHPNSEQRVTFIHDSHILFSMSGRAPEPDELFTDWEKRAGRFCDAGYLETIRRHGAFNKDTIPWLLLANCHGMPYCSAPYNSMGKTSASAPTNIGIALYRKLEERHESFFESIRQYLGPSYVRLPSLLALVLEGCRTPADIPEQILTVRHRFRKLRSTCTQLEIDLRTAANIREQIKILTAIDEAFEATAKTVESPKRRLLHRTFDVVKNIDPIKMGVSILDQAREYDLERQSFIKLPGYYDFWKASFDVQQGFVALERLFGRKNAANLAASLVSKT